MNELVYSSLQLFSLSQVYNVLCGSGGIPLVCKKSYLGNILQKPELQTGGIEFEIHGFLPVRGGLMTNTIELHCGRCRIHNFGNFWTHTRDKN